MCWEHTWVDVHVAQFWGNALQTYFFNEYVDYLTAGLLDKHAFT